VTQEDYEAFVRHVAVTCATSSPKKFVSTLMGWGIGLLVGVCISISWLSESRSTLAATFCGMILGALIMLMIVGLMSRRQLRQMKPSDDGFVIGKQQITLCVEGIRQTSSHHQMIMNWSCVCAVNATDKHVFVMVDRIGGFILPKRSFSTDEQREQFVGEIERQAGNLPKSPH
jgi:uncharacterized membrane protein YeaQ/YmgE (transglycosylase-associated protein family)